MPHRRFSSPDGTAWQAWDVPGRDPDDTLPGGRPAARELIEQGWLCFEADNEKRRLSPIPRGWAESTEEELWHYCQGADRVPVPGFLTPRS